MTSTGPSFGRHWLYRFSLPEGTEIEERELDANDTAEMFARTELCKEHGKTIVIERRRYAGAWEVVARVEVQP